jgi:hypothetical protein
VSLRVLAAAPAASGPGVELTVAVACESHFYLCHPSPTLCASFRIPREQFLGYIAREQRYDFTTATCLAVDARALREAPVIYSDVVALTDAGVSTIAEQGGEEHAVMNRTGSTAFPTTAALGPSELALHLPPSLPPAALTGDVVTAVVCVSTQDSLYRRKIASEMHYFSDISASYTGRLWGQRGLRPGKRYLQFCLRAALELCGIWGYLCFLHSSTLDDGTSLVDYVAQRWDIFGIEAVKDTYFKNI